MITPPSLKGAASMKRTLLLLSTMAVAYCWLAGWLWWRSRLRRGRMETASPRVVRSCVPSKRLALRSGRCPPACSRPPSGLGPDDVAGDIKDWTPGTADTSGQLRAERYGGTREYTLTYQGIDKAGNRTDEKTNCKATVTVPKPTNKKG